MKWTQLILFLTCVFLVAGQVIPATAVTRAGEQRLQDIRTGDNDDIRNVSWAMQGRCRIQVHTQLVSRGNEMIGVLERYNLNTTRLHRALDEYEALGPELQQALDEKDKNTLQTVNNSLKNAWRGFLKALRTLVKPGAPDEKNLS